MNNHAIFNCPLDGEIPENMERLLFGMGCFWGVERCFWDKKGIYRTAAGYAGGKTLNPSYQQICTGTTDHAEVVEVVYDPTVISTKALLEIFWENHDPTQGMRQGNDLGSQYRSMIVAYNDEQFNLANETNSIFQQQLNANGYGDISTDIVKDVVFYLAEDEHQQYLYKNPNGYCGLSGTGVCLVKV